MRRLAQQHSRRRTTHHPHTSWFRPQVELLENRLVLFKSWLTLQPNHEFMTMEAMPFLREDILDEINFEHIVQETIESFSSSAHFDNCEMRGAAAKINQFYTQAVRTANPNQFDSERTAEWFGKLLHAVQDFYAHSNWVDHGMQTLIDQNEGPWDALEPYSFHDGALIVQGTNEQPFGPGSLSRTGFRVFVRIAGESYPGIVTGTFGFGSHQCPRNIALPHGSLITPNGLNKDGPDEFNGALYHDAAWLTIQQTGHEFFRLVRMIEDTYGTAQHLIDAWVNPGGSPQGGQDVYQFLQVRREQPRYPPPRGSWEFPAALPSQFSIPEMDKRYLPRLAARAQRLGVPPNHPYLVILNSGDYAARLALGIQLHSHSHDHSHNHSHDHTHGDLLGHHHHHYIVPLTNDLSVGDAMPRGTGCSCPVCQGSQPVARTSTRETSPITDFSLDLSSADLLPTGRPCSCPLCQGSVAPGNVQAAAIPSLMATERGRTATVAPLVAQLERQENPLQSRAEVLLPVAGERIFAEWTGFNQDAAMAWNGPESLHSVLSAEAEIAYPIGLE